ncbi:hypothetical protein U2F26_31145 [Micromonospora sp. 4G57]|uniref:Uncharacterized protein n=1 Tax=Micromonospora sicca TaxID=2202420 RepID=A0ABU5JMV1_9ACTN|nr:MULTISPECIES: hypothetical protein [unclassified Micromonospora]MDZ5447122.1 hypothetical protein [Micromonospora sp. 4G57]MDZ5493724.1 hypothetical protein [Micromonospora sp. 4G53]
MSGLTGRSRRLVNPCCGYWIASGDTACLTAENGRITRICAILNPDKLARLDAEAALAR